MSDVAVHQGNQLPQLAAARIINFECFLMNATLQNHVVINGQQQSCTLNSANEVDCMAELQQQLATLMFTRVVSTRGPATIPLLLYPCV